jgi:hypothetical protein
LAQVFIVIMFFLNISMIIKITTIIIIVIIFLKKN